MNSSKKIKNQQNQEKDANKSSKGNIPAKKIKKPSRFAGMNLKPVILATLCIVVVLVLCIGVGIQQFKPKVVVTVDGTKIAMSEMMYPIYEVESQYLPYNEMYESYTGSSIWEADYQGSSSAATGVTNSIGLKQEVLNSEVQYELLYQKAKKAKYKLTKDEKTEAEKDAKKAIKGLSWLQKLQLNITESNMIERYEKRALATKFKDDKQKELNKDVDEATTIKDLKKTDYRQYDIQFYAASYNTTDDSGNTKALSDKEKKALQTKIEAVAKKAKSEKDFTKLISDSEKDVTFEKDGNFTEKDGWDHVSAENLKKIKKMKNGEISDAIIDATSGYYVVVKMVNNNSTQAYETACDDAIKTAQNAAYSTWFESEQSDKVVVNTDVWTDVTIGSVTTDIVTADDLQDMKDDSSSASSGSNE